MPITDIKFTNNARTLLSTSSLADDATSVSVDDGSVFPSLSSGNYFYATLERASDSTTREIVKVTARSGNDLTIVRAQDNTSATTFSADDIIELRVVAKALEDIRDAVITQEEVEDHVGGMLDGTETFIDVSYDDTDGNIDFVVPVKDEDNMASDSATHLATQQSIKAYVDTQVGTNTLTVYKYTATAGQTTFTGSDDASATLAYTVGNLFVTVNGITLENGTDYTATNGTSVVLTNAAAVDDEVNIYVFAAFNVSNVTQANGDFSVGDDLTLGSDGAIINMGADSDVTMTHVADTGVTLSAASGNATVLQIDADEDGASTGPKIILNRTSDSPADDDYTGTIIFQGENDNNQQFKTAQLSSQANDVSDGTEDSQLQLATIINGTLTNGVVLTSNGVSMPTQPAWGARGTGSVTLSGTATHTVMANSVEVTDIGGNYSTSTYRFTAPMDGTYYVAMSFTPTTLPGKTGPAQWLFKNGVATKELGINYSSDRFETTTGVYILALNAGDYIEQRVINYNNVSVTFDRSRGFFGGFLIG